jgi:hypothetical protein
MADALDVIARDHVSTLAKTYGMKRRGRVFYKTNDRDDTVFLWMHAGRKIGYGLVPFTVQGAVTTDEFVRYWRAGPERYARGEVVPLVSPARPYESALLLPLIPHAGLDSWHVHYNRFGGVKPATEVDTFHREWTFDPDVHDVDEFGRAVVRTIQKQEYLNKITSLLDRRVLKGVLEKSSKESDLFISWRLEQFIALQDYPPDEVTAILDASYNLQPELRARFESMLADRLANEASESRA